MTRKEILEEKLLFLAVWWTRYSDTSSEKFKNSVKYKNALFKCKQIDKKYIKSKKCAEAKNKMKRCTPEDKPTPKPASTLKVSLESS